MKKQNRWPLRAAALLVICGALMITVSFAAGAGSSEDPLVTRSYLEETFMKEIMEKVDRKIEQRNEQLDRPSETASANFTAVTLSKGETLSGRMGCEVMLRAGNAVCSAPSFPGLIDESSGAPLSSSDPLHQNHLYMMTDDGRGVTAVSGMVTLLVRGSYSVR